MFARLFRLLLAAPVAGSVSLLAQRLRLAFLGENEGNCALSTMVSMETPSRFVRFRRQRPLASVFEHSSVLRQIPRATCKQRLRR